MAHVRLELAVEDYDGVRRVDGPWTELHGFGPFERFAVEGEVTDAGVAFEVRSSSGEKATPGDMGAKRVQVEGWLVEALEGA